MNETAFFYAGLINVTNYNPGLTPEELSQTYLGLPAIRVHNKDWRLEFDGLIPGIVNFVEPDKAEVRIDYLCSKFCAHKVKIISDQTPHNAILFCGTFKDQPLKEIAFLWQKAALKTYVALGGLNHAPFVDCTIFRVNGMLKLYALCPSKKFEEIWKESCVEIAEKTALLNAGFSQINLKIYGR